MDEFLGNFRTAFDPPPRSFFRKKKLSVKFFRLEMTPLKLSFLMPKMLRQNCSDWTWPPLFGNVLEIHPFWKRRASLTAPLLVCERPCLVSGKEDRQCCCDTDSTFSAEHSSPSFQLLQTKPMLVEEWGQPEQKRVIMLKSYVDQVGLREGVKQAYILRSGQGP